MGPIYKNYFFSETVFLRKIKKIIFLVLNSLSLLFLIFLSCRFLSNLRRDNDLTDLAHNPKTVRYKNLMRLLLEYPMPPRTD